MPRAPVAAAIALLIAPSALFAQLPIAVRARARFDDLQARPAGLEVQIRGSLRDDLGRPVPLAKVRLGQRAQRTDADGRFEATLRFPGEGLQTIPLRFAGDLLLGPAEDALQVELGRQQVQLELRDGPEVAAGQPLEWRVRLRDRADRGAADAALAWRVDGDPWRTARTDRLGEATLTGPPLPPGPHLLEIRFGGDDQRGPARLTRGFEAARPLGVQLERLGGPGLRLAGRVAPGPGAATVTLILDGAPVRQLRTDPAGEWSAQLPTDGLRAGPHTLRALALSDAPGWRDGHSEELRFHHTPPPPPSPAWRLIPAALAGLALLGLALRRGLPRPRWRSPQPARALPSALVLERAPAGAPATLEIALVDALDGRPLSGWLSPAATPDAAPFQPPPAAQRVTAGDRLRLDQTPRWLWAGAPGYGPESVSVPGPGRATVRLLPGPAWAQRRFDALLQRAGRPPLRFGIQTPREAAAALTARGAPPEATAALLATLEAACFAREPALSLAELDALADTIEAALT